ncbi:biliverdin-producing heme oxygenase [Fulvivirga ligni]|uniref:biliverdin-producing heme oxygenase n=1 Tax=Fulvivirga ligni TaxID=2904246 RepID=UPI001F3D3ECE|nr:biliverdin-producing heme oxygenase [Fulvivirga ligni]UII19732.1 biliverdin-producing heme oxygenase [Fulvivirga ligni]
MISKRLKEETTPHHNKAEEGNFNTEIRQGTLSVEQYALFLQRNYWLNRLVEEHYGTLSDEQKAELKEFDIQARIKSHLILEDLKKLDTTLSGNNMPYPDLAFEELVGAIYVTEGSSLGGHMIHKALQKNSELADKDAFSFLGFYGDKTGLYWKKFIEALEGYYAAHTEDEDKIIEGAKKAFDYFIDVTKATKLN